MVTRSKSDDTFAGLPFGFNAQRLYLIGIQTEIASEDSSQFNSIKKLDYTPFVARLFVGVEKNLKKFEHTPESLPGGIRILR